MFVNLSSLNKGFLPYYHSERLLLGRFHQGPKLSDRTVKINSKRCWRDFFGAFILATRGQQTQNLQLFCCMN